MTQSNRTVDLGDRHVLTYLVGRAAYITQLLKRPGKGGRMSKIKSIYLAFDCSKQASRFSQLMMKKFGKFRVEMRKAKRVLDWAWEVKIQGDFVLAEIEEMARSLDIFYPEDLATKSVKNVSTATYLPFVPVALEPSNLEWFSRLPKRYRRSVALFC
ncbi:MAG: hypothetical protein F6K14_10600 [Symploca sp. SIO2C1]|nr:hypothetical protein [Symploca sp. SIO2C1]